jgi:hypothetical protein
LLNTLLLQVAVAVVEVLLVVAVLVVCLQTQRHLLEQLLTP